MKALAVAYPIATITVIVGTANHFVLDALGGAAVFGIAVMAERELRRWREQRALRRMTDDAPDAPKAIHEPSGADLSARHGEAVPAGRGAKPSGGRAP